MIVPSQIATLLDAREITSLRAQERTLKLARDAGMVVVTVSHDGVQLDGAIEATYAHPLIGPLLLTRNGRLETPRYDGSGPTLEHARLLAEQQVATLVHVEARASGEPFWSLSTACPHAAFSLYLQRKPYCRGLVIPSEFLPATSAPDGYQARALDWVAKTFGDRGTDLPSRCDRALEEMLEFLQALGYDRSAVDRAADYVYARPAGEPMQEAGGVMLTMASLCEKARIDMHAAAELELARVRTMSQAVLKKHGEKPRFGEPTPAAARPALALVQ